MEVMEDMATVAFVLKECLSINQGSPPLVPPTLRVSIF